MHLRTVRHVFLDLFFSHCKCPPLAVGQLFGSGVCVLFKLSVRGGGLGETFDNDTSILMAILEMHIRHHLPHPCSSLITFNIITHSCTLRLFKTLQRGARSNCRMGRASRLLKS